VTTAVYLDRGEERVGGTTMRELPFGRIEERVNRSTVLKGLILARLHDQPPGGLPGRPAGTVPVMPPAETVEVQPGPAAGPSEGTPTVELEVPSTRPKPAEFYRRVAEVYRQIMAYTDRPGIELARLTGVKVTTARGWIHEARRRGHLPPGTQGKAG
jgi:hypothetical protein